MAKRRSWVEKTGGGLAAAASIAAGTQEVQAQPDSDKIPQMVAIDTPQPTVVQQGGVVTEQVAPVGLGSAIASGAVLGAGAMGLGIVAMEHVRARRRRREEAAYSDVPEGPYSFEEYAKRGQQGPDSGAGMKRG